MPRNSERGLTLVEVVIVISLMGLLSAVITGFSTQALRSMKSGEAAQLVQSDLRFALGFMTRELMVAESVTLTPDRRTATYTKPGPITRNFEQAGQTIQRWDDQPLCSYVESLTFTLTGNILTIEIESVSSLPGALSQGGLPISLRTSIRLRNMP